MKGNAKKRVQMAILLGVLLLGGYAIGKTLFASGDIGPREGGKPPAFELADVEGNVHKLADYRGKPLIINFWGSFCPPCVKEMPEFQKQYEKWNGQGLEILAINLSEDDLTVKQFLAKFELEYTILRDRNKEVERRYRLRQYPTTFFVKPDGTIQEIFVGGMTEHDIDQRVTQLFGG